VGLLCARPTDGKGSCNSTVGGRDMTETQDTSIQNERWLPVVGYEGIYDVSNLGRIRRMKKGPGALVGRILKESLGDCGYMDVGLHKDGSQHTVKVHRLVSAAFLGECPDGKEVNHRDGVKPNNAATNLEYVTQSENALHAYRNGLKVAVHGERHGSAVLTEEKVHEIRRRLLAKETQASIAKRFHVCRATICHISTGRNWAWLKEE